MKYVPSLPPPATGAETGLEVKALTEVKRARTLPPRIAQPHARQEATHKAIAEERRHDPHVDGERRTYCRRVEHLPVLAELRSGMERRRHNQRAGDITEHVDVKA